MSTPDLKFKITAEDDTSRALRLVKSEMMDINRMLKRIDGSSTAAATRMSEGFARSGRAAQRMGAQMSRSAAYTGNLAAQFNDIGVMLAAGQSPLTLALQQGTQINQVFAQMGGGGRGALKAIGTAAMSVVNPMSLATIGIIAGGAALFQLGRKAFGASEEVKKFREAMKAANEVQTKMVDEIDRIQAGVGTMGELGLVRQIEDYQAALQRARDEQNKLLASARPGEQDRVANLFQDRFTEIYDQIAVVQKKLDEIDATRAELAFVKLTDKVGLAVAEALKLGGVDMGSSISAATIEAGKLAVKLGVALDKAKGILRQREAWFKINSSIYSNRFAAEEKLMSLPLTPNSIVVPAGGGGGGGGGGSGASQVNAALAEAKRLYDSTRTSAEKYAEAVARVNELHKEFPQIVDDAVQSRALKTLQDDFQKLDGLALKSANTIKAAFDGVFDDPEAALKRLSRQLAQMAFYSFLGKAMPNVFGPGGFIPLGNANGNVFSGGSVSAFANGGIVSGPTLFNMSGGRNGLMGEAGPEAILPLKRHGGKLGVIASTGGGVVVNVINNGQAKARTERRSGPNGREIIDVIIEEGFARGRYDKAQQGRFGNTTRMVKR